MSDITWRRRDNVWHALRGVFVRGRLYQDATGAFWFTKYTIHRVPDIELVGLTTIEEAKAAATLLLSLKERNT